MKQILMLCAVLLLSHSSGGMIPTEGYAQSKKAQNEEEQAKAEEKRKKLIREMERLIKVAKDAGFPEEELKKITMEQDGEVINVWEFLEQEQQHLSDTLTSQKVEEKKRHYLTVQDITSELLKSEPSELSRLRKELIFSGEEQK